MDPITFELITQDDGPIGSVVIDPTFLDVLQSNLVEFNDKKYLINSIGIPTLKPSGATQVLVADTPARLFVTPTPY
jgi:hypothetical protein